MNKYERPDAVLLDHTSEGVFAASGVNGSSVGDVTVTVTNADHYGNYYLSYSGFENGATYNTLITVNETSTVYGLRASSWDGHGGVVSGNTVSYTGVQFANQTTGHIRLWFDSQNDWENGWKLNDSDIPTINMVITKVG